MRSPPVRWRASLSQTKRYTEEIVPYENETNQRHHLRYLRRVSAAGTDGAGMSDKPTEIEVEMFEDDKRVVARFYWDYTHRASATMAFINDGNISLHLSTIDAMVLCDKLGEALGRQDFEDAGHPDPERAQEEADHVREGIENR